MKKIFTLITALTLSAGLWAINNVPYVDANGQPQIANEVTGVINSTDTLKDGWDYVELDAQGGEVSNRTYSESEVVASWNAVYHPGTLTSPTPEKNVYGITVNGTPVLGIKNEVPLDPSFEEWMVLNQSLKKGDLVTLYNQNGGATWVVTLDKASVPGIELNATGDAYIITQDGGYDFYMKIKFGADQLYVGYCAAPVEYKYTEYENWQIKYGNTWVWSDNMEKVEEGLFKLEIYWEGTGFNVQSDENPIKKDWYAANDPDVHIAEEVIPPVTVDVYLRVIDDEHLKIGIGEAPPVPGPTVDKTGITVNGRKYGFPVRLVKEVK